MDVTCHLPGSSGISNPASNESAVTMNSLKYITVRKPRRKTVSIVIQPDGKVEIRVPSFLTDAEVAAVAEKKRDWIQKKLRQQHSHENPAPSHSYAAGELFPLLGNLYTLEIISGRSQITLKGSTLQVSIPPGISGEHRSIMVKDILTTYFRQQALDILRSKTAQFAERYDLHPVYVSVKNYRSRWGCCFLDGRIFYNWTIILAPENIVDYVVVHELCHLQEAHHQKPFWQLVEQQIPDWKSRRAWLRSNGHKLTI